MPTTPDASSLADAPLDGEDGARIAIVGPAYPLRGGNALFVAHLYDCSQPGPRRLRRVVHPALPGLLFPGKTQMNVSHDPGEEHAVAPDDRLDQSHSRGSRTVRWILQPKRRPDLVVFVWWNPFFGICYGAMARHAQEEARRRSSSSRENVVSHENRFVDQFLTRFALTAADYFLVLSGVVASRIQSLFPRTPAETGGAAHLRAATRPTGIDRDAVRDVARTHAADGALLRIRPRVQGPRIPTAGDASDTRSSVDVELLVVGEFYDDRAGYDRIIEELGLAEHVTRRRGARPRRGGRATTSSAADVAVLPYVSATQSGITQIAYAFGLPVISTNVGGLPEVVRDGETGYIVESEERRGTGRRRRPLLQSGDERAR